ncbi:MAG: hypothetical protein F6K10_36500 [Moorea sp. SIO2B7]|uniref:Uncharacterized protein n=1 Tax=Moorena producens (strain JHB) TaxID=1454205 RepID=A0A9Q9UVU0_MOOP1|nr:hypothetical protein [Moorena producens]NES86427.1 hypothetical protein [Moorena sp. SIO2B7]WAN69185.1 hypothetical protein BJP36_43275 [Moorena producens JHB]
MNIANQPPATIAFSILMKYTHLFFPDSRFPTPDSRFPIPDSRFPIPSAIAILK